MPVVHDWSSDLNNPRGNTTVPLSYVPKVPSSEGSAKEALRYYRDLRAVKSEKAGVCSYYKLNPDKYVTLLC